MQISSKLFNQQQLKQFSSTTEELQDLQNKISTGENILRASDDPVGSVELSGLNVVKKQIEQYERNVNSANDRLSLLDKNLENLSNVQASKLSLDSASSTLDAAEASQSEFAGVNLDEEAAHLLEFQQAYQASARILQTAKEMFQSLIDVV